MVFDQWPDEWYEDKVQSAQMLKLIYHGRFLHGSVTLHALQLMPGKTTVMHLVTRENLPEPNSSGQFYSFMTRFGRCFEVKTRRDKSEIDLI
ncbi:hypothetical protein GCK72_009717 [Caenorhabditis remanei]|uniref:UBL3-like ubiquitin domain-containing protein n=1 Tax=Caenorhabditis remanei TaxID=31234 RepID=A0A6A5H378_CAERE|nr:hypothetical protein GCK72_009717 [Caenorhabditis remanei]KAF1761461.1 hypothetical protein GCK72_009717 [Caenorhabditis remanei]